jgi:Cu-processing system ATP-binding protein
VIEIKGLKKKFGKLSVLDGVSFEIKPGSITAIVGPNGSGKTTLIKSMLGLVHTDGGEIRIGRHILSGDCAYRRDIGYMPQIARYPENLKVKELLAMLKDLRAGHEELDQELLETLQLEKEMDKPIRALSGGTRQKVSALVAFMFSPQLLILDEPTAALDPVSSSRLKDKIIKENRRGKTVILTTHNMNEIEELSENIVFLLEGRIFFQGLIHDLKGLSGEANLERAVAGLMKEARS